MFKERFSEPPEFKINWTAAADECQVGTYQEVKPVCGPAASAAADPPHLNNKEDQIRSAMKLLI